MDILIHGMEMPTSCATCKLFGENGCPFIGAVAYALTRGKRHKDCPLVPAPEHGRWNNIIQGIIPSGQCSNCGAWDKVTRFCPNCGADMGEEN